MLENRQSPLLHRFFFAMVPELLQHASKAVPAALLFAYLAIETTQAVPVALPVSALLVAVPKATNSPRPGTNQA